MTDEYSRSSSGEIWTNHMSNWPLYVRDHPDDVGAQMLKEALWEIERLRKIGYAESEWCGRLLYAYVMSWHRFRWLMVKVAIKDRSLGLSGGWNYVKILNKWRKQYPDRGEPC